MWHIWVSITSRWAGCNIRKIVRCFRWRVSITLRWASCSIDIDLCCDCFEFQSPYGEQAATWKPTKICKKYGFQSPCGEMVATGMGHGILCGTSVSITSRWVGCNVHLKDVIEDTITFQSPCGVQFTTQQRLCDGFYAMFQSPYGVLIVMSFVRL